MKLIEYNTKQLIHCTNNLGSTIIITNYSYQLQIYFEYDSCKGTNNKHKNVLKIIKYLHHSHFISILIDHYFC